MRSPEIYPSAFFNISKISSFNSNQPFRDKLYNFLAKKSILLIWQGDKIFFDLLAKDAPFFHLELHYEGDTLAKAVLDGEKLALL